MAEFDDWLRVRDPNLVAEHLAEQYRLSQAEFERARDALAPAFALALRQAIECPARWAKLSQAFLEATPAADNGARVGANFVDAAFGSSDLRDAIARHASTVTGIAPDILTRMMPQLAGIAIDAMMRTAVETAVRQQTAGFATTDYGAGLAEMMRRGANAVEAMTRPSETGRPNRTGAPFPTPAFPFADAFAEIMRASLGSAAPASSRPRSGMAGMPDPAMPFAAMFDAFSKGVRPAPTVKDDPAGNLFATGRRMQEDYMSEMTALFDRYSGPGPAKR